MTESDTLPNLSTNFGAVKTDDAGNQHKQSTMKKPQRNAVCPCGSGLKFKRCCGSPGRSRNAGSLPQPLRVDSIAEAGQIKAIPTELYFAPITNEHRKVLYAHTSRVFHDAGVVNSLNWEPLRIQRLHEKIDAFCSQGLTAFELLIQHADGLCDPGSITELHDSGQITDARANNLLMLWNSIYWNEIDQYVHFYHVETVNRLAERVRRAFELFDDHLTLVCVARQILELTLSAIANNWVLSFCHIQFTTNVTKTPTTNTAWIRWPELEQFVQSLCAWQKKHLRSLVERMGRPDTNFGQDDTNYMRVNYEPTLIRQLHIAQFVTDLLDADNAIPANNLRATVDTLNGHYKYLNKFVHPNPQQFRVPLGYDFTDKDVGLTAQTCSLQVIESSLYLIDTLLLNQELLIFRFQDVADDFVYAEPGGDTITYPDQNGFLKDVMNGYKDLVIETTGGPLDVHKTGGLSPDAERVGRRFEQLSTEDKNTLIALLTDLADKQ